VITIVHLYPRELGINGDIGNVTALRRRAEWRGADVDIVNVGAGDRLPPDADLVVIGSGPSSARRPLHADIARHAGRLQSWADDDIPFLAVAAGWQLLGREVIESDGTVSMGAGIFPSVARVSAHRTVGEVAGESSLGEVAGFVNYGAETVVDAGVTALARLASGDEGIVVGNRIATHLHGPFLPMNPAWADRLLESAGQRAGVRFTDPRDELTVADEYARRSREAIRGRLGQSR
jgi:CobQ-like glutamine amidotransferase family enzyme